jgi:hypothetical protein
VQGQRVAPFCSLGIVGAAMGDLAVGIVGEQVGLPVSDETIEVLGVGRTHDASRRLVDDNGGRKHIFSPFHQVR